MTPEASVAVWEERFRRHGHTGYGDALVYRYDQPLRLRLLARALRRALPAGRPGRALDLGCGTGDVTALLRATGATVVGVDLSLGVLGRTHRRFAGDRAVALLAASADAIPLASRAVDVVTSVTVLQHLAPLERLRCALQELRRVLVPGGRLISLEISPCRASGASVHGVGVEDLLVERDLDSWLRVFDGAGFATTAVTAYAPVGTDSIRLLRALWGRLERRRARTGGGAEPASVGRSPGGRGLARSGYGLLKRAILAAAYPLDYVARVRYPSFAAYYHMFELESR